MAWNPRCVWSALLAAGLMAGIAGCEPAKKSGDSAREKPSREASPIESMPKPSEESPSQATEKAEPAAEPADKTAIMPIEPTVKPPVDAPATPRDDNPPPVPAPKKDEPIKLAPKEKRPLLPPAAIPKVFLSEELRAACLVNVGDALPQGEFSLDGKKAALDSLYGESLTVVFFWTSGSRSAATELFEDMQKDVLEPFEEQGLKVVAIKVGDKPEDMKAIAEKSGAKYPAVEDPAGRYFHAVATGKLPRVYLLDGGGKILWFDIGYVRATRRDLQTAIRAVLEGKK
ncbi:MAG: redoxin domain-containing protein [Pirellulales bacterium]|nr:redoxin domain-containing protein [Pirellulales bacterium]